MTIAQERETIINWNDAEEMVSIYTASQPVARKCLKLGYKLVKTDRLAATHKECSWRFECPKECVLIRHKPQPRVLSVKDKAMLSMRLHTARTKPTAPQANSTPQSQATASQQGKQQPGGAS